MITIYEYEQLDLYIGQGQPKLIKSWTLKTFGERVYGETFSRGPIEPQGHHGFSYLEPFHQI